MPRSASSSPTSVLSSVVLPAPLRPSTSIRSPRPTSKLTSSNTVFGPNAFARSATSSVTSPARGGSGRRTRTLRSARAAVTRFAVSFSTRWSSVLAVRARFSVWPRIELASAFNRSISLVWRAASLVRRCASSCRATRYCEYVPAVLDELALVDVQHARDRLVEQLEVVTDHEEPAAERPQELHEPLLGVDVEVVRGLVEQEEVAPREQDPRELDSPALTARERGDRKVEPVGAEAEPGGDAPNLGVGRVAAGVPERVFGVAVARTLRGDASSAMLRWSSSSRRLAASRPRADSTCASAVPSSPVPRGDGSCER